MVSAIYSLNIRPLSGHVTTECGLGWGGMQLPKDCPSETAREKGQFQFQWQE